jgi:hypothetical protein
MRLGLFEKKRILSLSFVVVQLLSTTFKLLYLKGLEYQ